MEIIASIITFLLLLIIKIMSPMKMLIAERIWGNAGWIVQAVFVSLYAAFIYWVFKNKRNVLKYRVKFWTFFSLVFFSQFIFGYFVSKVFLMSGALHIPVPAMIVAGPIYRGSGFFMVFLFLAVVALIGPAWCSHICYFGSFDNYIANKSKAQNYKDIFYVVKIGRYITLAIVAVVPIMAGSFTKTPTWAIVGGISFGVIGLLIILIFSYRFGKMFHCTGYCPIGVLSNLFGKISPFRIQINNDCDKCMSCSKACKYMALYEYEINEKKPSLTCTLCGDCFAVCHKNAIEYRFWKLSPESARKLFLLLLSVIMALFLAVSRI